MTPQPQTLTLGEAFRNRSNNFNVLRLLAAFCVIYGHSYAITRDTGADIFLRLVGLYFIGGVAVHVFFIISGFLVTESLIKRKDVLFFLFSRFSRIYPALVICVLLCALVLGPLVTTSQNYWDWKSIWRFIWVNGTAYDAEYSLPGVFAGQRFTGVNGSLWSMVVEVRMYLAVLIFYLLGILKRKTVFNIFFFAALLVSFFYPETVAKYIVHENHRQVALFFLVGMFYCLNRDEIPLNNWILLLLLLFSATLLHTDRFYLAYTVILPYLVFMFAYCPGLLWFNRVGDYSYGVYLYGWPVQQTLVRLNPGMSALSNTLWGCTICLLLGMTSWYLVEKPALSLKKRLARARLDDATPVSSVP